MGYIYLLFLFLINLVYSKSYKLYELENNFYDNTTGYIYVKECSNKVQAFNKGFIMATLNEDYTFLPIDGGMDYEYCRNGYKQLVIKKNSGKDFKLDIYENELVRINNFAVHTRYTFYKNYMRIGYVLSDDYKNNSILLKDINLKPVVSSQRIQLDNGTSYWELKDYLFDYPFENKNDKMVTMSLLITDGKNALDLKKCNSEEKMLFLLEIFIIVGCIVLFIA